MVLLEKLNSWLNTYRQRNLQAQLALPTNYVNI